MPLGFNGIESITVGLSPDPIFDRQNAPNPKQRTLDDAMQEKEKQERTERAREESERTRQVREQIEDDARERARNHGP